MIQFAPKHGPENNKDAANDHEWANRDIEKKSCHICETYQDNRP
jgi:hypothetical protein